MNRHSKIAFALVVFFSAIDVEAAAAEICESLLSNGIRDTSTTNLSEGRFSQLKNSICRSEYDSYSKASNSAAKGELDVPSVFGISAGSSSAESEYSTKWRKMCSANFSEASSNLDLRTYTNAINQRLLTSFDRCVESTSERFIRYVEPSQDGRTFAVKFLNKRSGQTHFILEQLTLLDTTASKKLDPSKDCDLYARIPYDTKNYNSLTILCSKNPKNSVVVNAKTSAGPIDPVTVPAVPELPPSLADRLVSAEAKISALETQLLQTTVELRTAQNNANARIGSLQIEILPDGGLYDIAVNGGERTCPAGQVAYGFKNQPDGNWAIDMWRCAKVSITIPPTK